MIADAPLTGQTTRWDYASVDGGKHRLYLAHLGDSVVTVFDTRRQVVVKDIPKVSHVTVLAIPELGRIYASATGTDEVVRDRWPDARDYGTRARRSLSGRDGLRAGGPQAVRVG